jgi:hypothetical protein
LLRCATLTQSLPFSVVIHPSASSLLSYCSARLHYPTTVQLYLSPPSSRRYHVKTIRIISIHHLTPHSSRHSYSPSRRRRLSHLPQLDVDTLTSRHICPALFSFSISIIPEDWILHFTGHAACRPVQQPLLLLSPVTL